MITGFEHRTRLEMKRERMGGRERERERSSVNCSLVRFGDFPSTTRKDSFIVIDRHALLRKLRNFEIVIGSFFQGSVAFEFIYSAPTLLLAVSRTRSFHFGSHRSSCNLIFSNFDGSTRPAVHHFASLSHLLLILDKICQLFPNEEKRKAFNLFLLASNFFFQRRRGRGDDHEGAFETRVKLALETIRNLVQDRFEDSAQG